MNTDRKELISGGIWRFPLSVFIRVCRSAPVPGRSNDRPLVVSDESSNLNHSSLLRPGTGALQ